jgi:hypothetical protein
VVVREAGVKGAAAVAGGAKSHLLLKIARLRVLGVIGRDQAGDVGKIFDRGGLSGEWMKAHVISSFCFERHQTESDQAEAVLFAEVGYFESI